MQRFQRILCRAGMVLLLGAGSAFAQAPTLFFTDLESGPNTGGENNQGAYVTVYGNFFGSSQGASTVTVGGGLVDNCPVWGAAWLWYQKITCQLGSNAATGNIVVTIAGQSSNGLPFTVRPGHIYFVDLGSGSDSGDGSFSTPWLTPIKAKNTMAPGDIAYQRTGYWTGTDYADGASGLVMSNNSGAPGLPKALLGYPGETAGIRCKPPSSICDEIRSASGPSSYWVFGELDLGGNVGNTQYIIDYENSGGGDGIRWIGNKIHGAKGTNVVLQGNMNGSYFLGNDDYDYWSIADGAGSGERGYGIYYGGYGTQQNINVLWNRFYNDQGTAGLSTKGLQIYAHCPHDCAGINDYFKNVTVANNQFLNNCMSGAAIGGTDGGTNPWEGSGPMYFYNNVVAGNGSCDTINMQTYSGLEIGDGYGGMNAKIWNNTFYLNAGGSIGTSAGDVYMFDKSTESFDFSNNIFYAQPPGQTYNNFIFQDASPGGGSVKTGSNNLFFSNSNPKAVAPSWVSGTVSTANPNFVSPGITTSADFHLQASSPAIDSGATSSLISQDISGTPRPQGAAYDVGAYEYGSGYNPPPPPPPPPSAPAAGLSAAPASIAPGQSSVLTYSCTNCTSATINGTATPATSGQMQVTPSATTTYTLAVSGAGGSATATTTVTVTTSTPPPPPPAPTASLIAAPTSIAQGQSSVLTYSCTNCASATINGTATAGTSGQMQVTPSSTTTYTLVVSGAGGSATTAAAVTVAPTPPPPPGTPDLNLSKTHSGNFSQGQVGARYTITVGNIGSGPTSGAVTVTDTLPTGLTATAISGTGWTCTLSTLKCTRSTALAAGASYSLITVTVNVSGSAPSSVINSAAVSGGGEQNIANDTAIDLTEIGAVQPDLLISIMHGGDFTPGQTGAIYTLIVSNVGNMATSGMVSVTDTLPAGLTATAISGTGWTCTLSTLKCTRTTALAVGGSYPAINLTVNVAANAPASVTNTATVSGGNEQNITNDIAADLTIVDYPPAMMNVSPDTLQFSAVSGSTQMSQTTIQMKNIGGGTLGWTGTVVTDSGSGWLVAGPTSGVAPSTVAVTANPSGLAPGTYAGRIVMTAMPGTNATNSPQTLTVQMVVGGTPAANNGGVVNGASYAADGVTSPGALTALFGQNMATGAALAGDLPLPLNLLGTEVLVNGIRAPLYFVSASQIDFQMPYEVSGPTAQVVVSVNGSQSAPVVASLADQAPGIFTATSNGAGQGAVLNGDGTPNSASNPAPAGSVIAIYATGMGVTLPTLHSGEPGGPANLTVVQPAILIGGVPVPASSVQFSGAAPGLVGLDQINVQIPPGTASGSDISLQIQMGARSSNTATIAVQ